MVRAAAVEDTVEEEDMAEVTNHINEMVDMVETREAMATKESQRITTVNNITPKMASILKKLQIYQCPLQYKKTFMLSMRQLQKDQRKKMIKLCRSTKLRPSEKTSQDLSKNLRSHLYQNTL